MDSLQHIAAIKAQMAAPMTPVQQSSSAEHSVFGSPILPLFLKFWPSYLMTNRRSLPPPPAVASASDEYAADLTILESDEDYARDVIDAERRHGFDELVIDYQRSASEIAHRNLWSGTGQLTPQQLENLYIFLFVSMRSRIQQHFDSVFPFGVRDSGLAPDTVAVTVCCLLLIDIAVSDDDHQSFALTVVPGQRVSLDNCPPERRLAYFSFMAFKSVMQQIAGSGAESIDAFRTLVVRYLSQPTSIHPVFATQLIPVNHPVARVLVLPRQINGLFDQCLPAWVVGLRALFNAAFPLVDNEMFQARVSAFYHHVVLLEHELKKQPQTFMVTESSSEAEHAVHRAAADQQQEVYRKGSLVGHGAYGTVYEAIRLTDGITIALKELNLRPPPSPPPDLSPSALPLDVSPSATQVCASTTAFGDLSEFRLHESSSSRYIYIDGNNETNGSLPAQLLNPRGDQKRAFIVAQVASEIGMLQRLHHKNIVQYYGCRVDEKKGKIVIAMEYVPKTLTSIIKGYESADGGLPDSLIAHYSRGILSGLVYLHEHHIVHRDIKSANILVSTTGEVKVSDFGASIMTTQSSGKELQVQGTPPFIAPEVLCGATPLPPSDIWAFGGVLMELATGHPPFYAEEFTSLYQIVNKLCLERSPPSIPRNVSQPLREIIQMCMDMDPCKRPTAQSLLAMPFFRG